ncbi:hypothetical protein ACTOB_006994 [Actinoplanes oblitus]|uniref:Serine/threonine protein kinase n=1 Tax=Actinoplanes oblitus TaxID=3040509 RepID=A0ABY8WGT3_9ACTN|nr:hypothetical protein [Actinoplanes oblitus]WIM94935.1 hypothetical protein ACTOB_006994 [Actinoplanes oblitus]
MSDAEQGETTPEGSLYASAAATTAERRNRRRKQALVGATGLAAVLAGAGFLATQLMQASQPSLPEPAALAPATTQTPSDAPVTSDVPTQPPASRATKPAQAAKRSPTPTPSVDRAKIEQEIAAARASAAADGVPLKRPLTAPNGVQEATSVRTESTREGSVRITTAHYDLTGHQPLLIAADRGKPVGGGVRCTNKVRFSANAPAVERPSLLLCWRTSSERSVVTMATNPSGEPDPQDSVKIIDREWATLD